MKSSKETASARILALETALDQLSGESGAYDGTVSLPYVEQLSSTIKRLSQEVDEAEDARRRAELIKRTVEAELDEKQLEIDTMRSEIADLKSIAMQSAAGSDFDARVVGKRLLDLNEQIKVERLQILSLKRQKEAAEEEKLHYMRLHSKDQDHISQLENHIVSTERLAAQTTSWNCCVQMEVREFIAWS